MWAPRWASRRGAKNFWPPHNSESHLTPPPLNSGPPYMSTPPPQNSGEPTGMLFMVGFMWMIVFEGDKTVRLEQWKWQCDICAVDWKGRLPGSWNLQGYVFIVPIADIDSLSLIPKLLTQHEVIILKDCAKFGTWALSSGRWHLRATRHESAASPGTETLSVRDPETGSSFREISDPSSQSENSTITDRRWATILCDHICIFTLGMILSIVFVFWKFCLLAYWAWLDIMVWRFAGWNGRRIGSTWRREAMTISCWCGVWGRTLRSSLIPSTTLQSRPSLGPLTIMDCSFLEVENPHLFAYILSNRFRPRELLRVGLLVHFFVVVH